MSQEPRAFETSIDLDFPVEDVWRALTDAEELVKWFPLEARLDLRPGGVYEISWEGDWTWTMTVTDCEPPRRLRMVTRDGRPFDADGKPVAGLAPVDMALEFLLESIEGHTRLRLVHSGFGHGAQWDDELEGVAHGWRTELRGLRHYLTHHRGRARHLAWARRTANAPPDLLWETLTSPQGLIAAGDISQLREGDRCALTLVTGDLIEGRVLYAAPGRQLLASADNLERALFRIAIDRAGDRSMVNAWLSSWTRPATDGEWFRGGAQDVIDRMLTQPGQPV